MVYLPEGTKRRPFLKNVEVVIVEDNNVKEGDLENKVCIVAFDNSCKPPMRYKFEYDKQRSWLKDGDRVDIYNIKSEELYKINKLGVSASKSFIAMAKLVKKYPLKG